VAQSIAEAAEILRTLESSMTTDTASRIWDRLRPFRFERDRPMRAFTAVAKSDTSPARSGTPESGPARDALLEVAQTFGLPLVLEVDEGDGFSGLAGDRVVLDDWLREAAHTHQLGLSEPFEDLHLARARMRDAHRALQVLLRRRQQGHSGSVLRFEDVDLATWLIASRPVDAVASKARQQLGDLLDREDLTETVAAYLNSNLDIRDTARALFLHPNSVRYRLHRVEELVGAPITSAAVVANLYLALHDQLAEPGVSGTRPVR
jgi:purine catabolism regulator